MQQATCYCMLNFYVSNLLIRNLAAGVVYLIQVSAYLFLIFCFFNLDSFELLYCSLDKLLLWFLIRNLVCSFIFRPLYSYLCSLIDWYTFKFYYIKDNEPRKNIVIVIYTINIFFACKRFIICDSLMIVLLTCLCSILS